MNPGPQEVQPRPAAALAVLIAGVLIVAGTSWLRVAEAGPFPADEVFQPVVNLSFILLAAITVWRRPDNRMSWLFAWIGVVTGLSMLADEYGTIELTGGRPPLAGVASWVSAWIWVPAFGPLLLLMLLWFPTGRVPSPRWMPVERAAFSVIGAMSLVLMFAQDPESAGVNPLAIPWVTAIADKMFIVIGPTFPILLALCLASLVMRFRRSRGDERQQLKWFVLAGGLLLVYIVADTAMGARELLWLNLVEAAAFLSLPLAAGMAILRYRLYDIDVVINRTLVYLGLTAILGASYLGIVVLLQQALGGLTEGSDLIVAGSTLAVAALFRPVRSKVQSFIDRRFYRHKYDASATLGEFSSHLRDQVDLESLNRALVRVVGDTMQPAHVSLWIRAERSSA